MVCNIRLLLRFINPFNAEGEIFRMGNLVLTFKHIVNGDSEVKLFYLIYGLLSDAFRISEFFTFDLFFIIIYVNIFLAHYKILFTL
jgi:hypothetical protein